MFKYLQFLTLYTNISPTDMPEAAFYMCAYEFAIKTINSPWCQLFDEDDAKVKELQWSTVQSVLQGQAGSTEIGH